jgi:hypothetical protein
MRLPFFNPRKDEVAAIATDLITRFGLRAHEEAAHLAELSLQMGSRRKGALYESVAREIEASFLEARRQRGLRQSASDIAHLGGPVPEGNDGGPEHPGDGMAPTGPAPHIHPYALGGLIAELNRADPSPRRPRPRSARLRL